MKNLRTILFTLTLILTLSISALAQDPVPTPTPRRGTKTPVINQRQENQRNRIKQGVRSGELTAKETAKLAKEVHENKEAKVEAKSDGVVTRAERKEIHQNQNQTSRKIYRAKHNNRSRN
jgi:hypothetical protein